MQKFTPITSGYSGRPIYFKSTAGMGGGQNVDLFPSYVTGPYSSLGLIQFNGSVAL